MEETINYQDKFVPFTKAQFEAKDRLISNIELEDESKYLEGLYNYANPLIGANGKYYMVLNNEVLQHFTQTELDSAVDYEQIVLTKK
jgi:hypothetical protein